MPNKERQGSMPHRALLGVEAQRQSARARAGDPGTLETEIKECTHSSSQNGVACNLSLGSPDGPPTGPRATGYYLGGSVELADHSDW